MKLRITALGLLVSSIYFSQTLTTQTRDDAGAPTTQSGFYQTFNPVNYPPGATEWWHLLDVRHTSTANNFGMQFAGSFFNQELWFRKTHDSPTKAWSKIVLENPEKNVFIGNNLTVTNDILTGGSNSWIFHSPDDGRKTLHIAPMLSNGQGDWDKQITFNNNGNASFQGKVEAKEVKVTQSPTADFVFEENYNLPKLEEVEKHIKEKKHLPEIASAKEMEKEGVNIGEFQIKLLQKIEELTLYSIEQNKQIKTQSEKIQQLESENQQIKVLLERIEKLEKKTEKNKK